MRLVFLILMFACAFSIFGARAVANAVDDINAGAAASNRGDYDEAIRLFTQALNSGQLSSQNREIAFSNRGISWFNKGEYDKAIADYDEALRLNPQDDGIFLSRGVAWFKKGDYDKALADENEAIRLNPRDAEAFNNRGNAWLRKGDDDKAIADYSESIRLNPNYAMALGNRGVAWEDKGEFDKEIADESAVIRLEPRNANAYNHRGSAWRDKGEYDKAVADYSESIRLNPRNAHAIYNRGLLEFYQGNFEQSSIDFAKAQLLAPSVPYPAIWLYLSQTKQNNQGAEKALVEESRNIDANKWPAPVISMFTDKISPETVAAKAVDADPKTQKNRMCEANFYTGEWYLQKHHKKQAQSSFSKARNECPKSFDEYLGAVAELKRM